MTRVFTEYVRALEPGHEPPPERFRAVWGALRSALVGELRKRSLWNAPPSYLGVVGFGRWSDDDALEELLVDCYTFVFLCRLEGLKALLEERNNVEGMIWRNIRNFLHNVQKKHDPLGFRVFEALRGAVRRSLADGTLHLLAGDPRIRNETILGFAPWYDPGERTYADLRGPVSRWSDELLPELVTARGPACDDVTAKLTRCLANLRDHGVELFRFQDVVDPLKEDVRARWRTVWRHSEGELGIEEGDEEMVRLVRLVRPDGGPEERQAFQRLLACVAESLAHQDEVTAKTGAYLHRLWVFVRSHVVEEEGDRLPARQRIAELLGIPRYRIPELLGTLGHEIERCRGAGSGKPPGKEVRP